MAKHRSIGLDIGTTAVRAAEVEFSTGGIGGELHRFHTVPLPPDVVRDGEVVDRHAVAGAIRELFSKGGFASKEVILGIGNQRVAVRSMALPWAPLDELRLSLPYQVQDLLPMPVEDALLDFYPIEEVDDQGVRSLDGMLVAAVRETVSSNVATAELAGLVPVGVDLNAFALLRVMTRGQLASRTVALVDIGARITTVIITSGGVPRFVRALPLGGQDATDAFAKALGIAGVEAERIKCDIGLGSAKYPELRDGADAMAESTTKLVEAIRGTFTYFSTNAVGNQIDVVSLTGGGANLVGLGQYLASASRLNVVLGDPLEGTSLAKSSGGRAKYDGVLSTMAIPVGLAYGVGEAL